MLIFLKTSSITWTVLVLLIQFFQHIVRKTMVLNSMWAFCDIVSRSLNFKYRKFDDFQIFGLFSSFFEIFFVLDLAGKKAHIEMSACIIETFDRKKEINTTNTVHVIGASISIFWQVQVNLGDQWWYLWQPKYSHVKVQALFS